MKELKVKKGQWTIEIEYDPEYNQTYSTLEIGDYCSSLPYIEDSGEVVKELSNGGESTKTVPDNIMDWAFEVESDFRRENLDYDREYGEKAK